MSTQNAAQTLTLIAAADLSAKQFYAMKVDSNGQAAVAGAGEVVVGVLQNDPASGQAACVATAGVVRAVAGGSITAGATVAANASGKFVDAAEAKVDTSDAGGAADPVIGSYVFGVALEGASTNDIFRIQVLHAGAVATTAA